MRRALRQLRKMGDNGALSFPEFEAWALANTRIVDLLEEFRVLPSPNEQRRQLRTVLESQPSLEVGQTWYVLSSRWWEEWCEYVEYLAVNRDTVVTTAAVLCKRGLGEHENGGKEDDVRDGEAEDDEEEEEEEEEGTETNVENEEKKLVAGNK